MKQSIIKSLLFDFFDGNATTMQRKLVEEWLIEPENQETYYHYLDEWEATHPQFAPDEARALKAFRNVLSGQNELSDKNAGSQNQTNIFRLNKWLWLVAAACLFFASCFAFRKDILYKTYESATGKTTICSLSDGTDVILNTNSTLRVPRFGFGKGGREVFLDGEAEFKVTHTANNDRFVVNMSDDYQIEVLGTEFVAFARERGKRVFLKTGKVKLKLPEGKRLYMKPGNLFVSAPDGKFQVTEQADPRPMVAWKDRNFYFDNTLLSEVAQQIQERFDIDVRIPDTLLANRKIGGIYKADQADDILQILSELMQIEITQKDDYIELSTPKLP